MATTRETDASTTLADERAAPTPHDGFESSDDDAYVVKKVDFASMSASEKRVQRWKDCFWELEATLARWFGVDASRYEFERNLKEEENERAERETASLNARSDRAQSDAEGGGRENRRGTRRRVTIPRTNTPRAARGRHITARRRTRRCRDDATRSENARYTRASFSSRARALPRSRDSAMRRT